MKKVIIPFLCFTVAVISNLTAQSAQTTPKALSAAEKAYQSNTMYLTYGSKYKIDGKEGSLFFNTPKVKQLFATSPDGYKEYKQYQANKTTSLVLDVLGSVSFATGLFIVVDGKQAETGRGLMIGGLAAPLISLPINMQAQKKAE